MVIFVSEISVKHFKHFQNMGDINGVRKFVLMLCVFCGLCAGAMAQAPAFRLPDVPDSLRTHESRANYLVMHYWDHYDFSDTTLITASGVSEQAYVNFINVLPLSTEASAAVDLFYSRASASKTVLRHFIALGDKYLYEPNSPMFNEELYVLMLQVLVDNPQIEEIDKATPRFRLEFAMKNRPGTPAEDFTVYLRDGSPLSLSSIDSEFLIVYFNDPDCMDCRLIKEKLAYSSPVRNLVKSGRMKILSVCVEGRTEAWNNASYPDGWIDACDEGKSLTVNRVYDLKAMPTIYLLDSNKDVIFKDVEFSKLVTYLRGLL